MKNKMKALTYVLLLTLLVSTQLVPTANAAVIGHDQVVGFAEVTPTTTTQIAAKLFQPTLKVSTGCVPYPAVDAEGNTSGGLSTSGNVKWRLQFQYWTSLFTFSMVQWGMGNYVCLVCS